MAEDGDAVNTACSPTPDEEVTTNDTASSAQERETRKASLRATGSKIASLRAQFERDDSDAPQQPRKRLQGNDQPSRLELETELALVKKQLGQESHLRASYEEKCFSLEQELQAAQSQPQNQSNGMSTQEEVLSENEGHDAGSRLARAEAREREARRSAAQAQQQLVDLKRSISTSTRVESQASDSSFVQEMGALHHEIQNWVVNNFRKARAQVDGSSLSPAVLTALGPNRQQVLQLCRSLVDGPKIAIYQAIVIVLLLEVFEDRFLYGVGDQYPGYQKLCEASDSLETVLSEPSHNKWRALTFDQIRQSPGISATVDEAAQQLAAKICEVVGAVSEIEDYGPRESSLTIILTRAIALAHLFRVQRPRYKFFLPIPGATLDTSSMEDAEVDSSFDSHRTIKCATFPAVAKLGDEQGTNLHLHGIILRAKVLCNND